MTEHVDVLVVGSGGSGAPLAARLSEDSARRVLVLEAGPVPRTIEGFPAELLDGGTVAGARPGHPDNWSFGARLTPDRAYSIARGRILGGSTTINGGYFERARPADFAQWSAGGNDLWAPERVLPLQRRLERDLDFGETATHGGSGPMPVRRASLEHPAAAAFAAAAAALGSADEPDKNDSKRSGFGPVPSNLLDGVRWNTGIAYLMPALGRANLTVRGGTTVTRVIVDHGRAVGVETLRDGRIEVFHAGEVVLCAGTIGSAVILLRSGIGPSRELRALDIPVQMDAAVGVAVGDHPQLVLEWQPRDALPRPSGSWMAGALNVDASDADGVDLEVLQSLVSMSVLTATGPTSAGAPLPLLVSVQTPISQGRIRLASADPSAAPLLDYGYLRTAADRARLRTAARFTVELIESDAFAQISTGLGGSDGLELSVLGDDTALDGWVASHLGTSIHGCGSAPFASAEGPDAVVDQQGRVLGMPGLRVADTSILPTAPRRGPAATAVLIGELVAEAMRWPG